MKFMLLPPQEKSLFYPQLPLLGTPPQPPALACDAQAVRAQRHARQKAASAIGQALARPDACRAKIRQQAA